MPSTQKLYRISNAAMSEVEEALKGYYAAVESSDLSQSSQANLKAVEQMVKEYDIRIAIHNHGPEDRHFPSAQSVLEAVSGLDPRCGLCMDVGHAYRAIRMPRLLAAEAARKGNAANTSNSGIVGALEDAAAARSGNTVYDDDPVKIIAQAGSRLRDDLH